MRWILFALMVVAINYVMLYDLDAFRSNYFVSLHASLLFLGGIIVSIIHFIRKTKPDFLGIGITAGLLVKMIFMTTLFIYMYKKLNLSNLEMVNFLGMYAIYTVLITFYAISQLKFNK